MKSFKNSKEDLNKIPTNTSGIYYFYDDNRLLYVGKAKNLKSRTTEHYTNNLKDREGKFLAKMMRAKGIDPLKREEWPKEFDRACKDFDMKYLFHHQDPLVIDMIFHKVSRIEIEEIHHELTKQKEKDIIKKLEPPFNYQTACDEYYEILHE